jgi:hypothetical protein
MAYRTFGEQTLTYFDRAHVEVPRSPVGGPAAWRGADLEPADWRVDLTNDEIAELRHALAHAVATGKELGDLTAEDFPLPDLAATIDSWRDQLVDGRGFVVVSGLPVDKWGDRASSIAFWCLGLHLGQPGEQNADGDLLGHVTDTGDDADDPLVRLYRTSSNIRFHCDLADAVGLLCLRNSGEGGLSRIASSVAVHDELLRTRPELVARLYEPFELDTRNEGSSIRHIPVVPCRFDGTHLRTFFHSDYYRSVERHDDVGPLSTLDLEALDAFEQIAEDPSVRLDMSFEPGDIQLVSNHTIVHARTGYRDDERCPRHLLRLWLTLR